MNVYTAPTISPALDESVDVFPRMTRDDLPDSRITHPESYRQVMHGGTTLMTRTNLMNLLRGQASVRRTRTFRETMLPHCVMTVIRRRPQEQMIRVEALWSVATMTDESFVINAHTQPKNRRHAVYFHLSALPLDRSITATEATLRPQPASSYRCDRSLTQYLCGDVLRTLCSMLTRTGTILCGAGGIASPLKWRAADTANTADRSLGGVWGVRLVGHLLTSLAEVGGVMLRAVVRYRAGAFCCRNYSIFRMGRR